MNTIEQAKRIVEARKRARRANTLSVNLSRKTVDDIAMAINELPPESKFNEYAICEKLRETYDRTYVGKNEKMDSFEYQMSRKHFETTTEMMDAIYFYLKENYPEQITIY